MNTAVPRQTAIPDIHFTQVGVEDIADVMEQAEIQATLELGAATIYKVTHPSRGNLILVNTTGDHHAVIQC